MSWFSSAISWVGNTAKSVVSTVAKVALPVVSSVVGAIPVIGGIGSKIVDGLGNKAIEAFDSLGGSNPQGAVDQMVEAAAANNSDATLSRYTVDASASTVPASAKGFLGIGDGKPGVLGIGDGKPGVLGIGTGKNKARKAAEAAATAQGKTPAEVKAAGDKAAAAVIEDEPETGSTANVGLIAAIAAAAALLLL